VERRRIQRRHGDALADVGATLPASDTDLAAALAAITDPVYVVDRLWRIRWANARTTALWGDTLERLVGRSLWDVHPHAVRSHPYEHLVHAMRERRPAAFEAFSSALGSWVEVRAYPAGDGLLVYYRSVDRLQASESARHALVAERAARAESERLATELRAARDAADAARHAAERAQARAESAAQAKGDFLATMSHELRTPINAVTGYAQLLELGVAGPVTDRQREYLARLHASGRHLLGLVDDVLDLAKLDTGRLTVNYEPARTSAAIGDALAVVATQAAARAIRLVVELDDPRAGASAGRSMAGWEEDAEAGLPYVGDAHRVRQILVNLLSNALKFTPPGGTVTVRAHHAAADARPGGPWTCLQVTDTGTGVPAELRDTVFEPFVQGDGSRTRTVGGSGLGLSVGRRLARLMGGDLTLEPDGAGEGATFTLWLPTRAPNQAPAGVGATGVGVTGITDAVALAIRQPGAPAPDPTPVVAPAPEPDRGLGAVAHHLRKRLESLLDGYVARLRTDRSLPEGHALSRAQLEDHGLSFLADLAQSLVVIHETGGLDSELLRDGSAIQEQIAFRHGEQRHRLGWAEQHLYRDYAVLEDEIDMAVRRFAAARDGVDVPYAQSILHRLLVRARDVSLHGWRHAATR
jgi:signal transduction histidine kinase